MNTYSAFRYLRFFVCCVLVIAGHVFAATPPWPPSPVTYIASHEKVSQVFANFGRTFGLEVELTPAVQGDTATVTGKISSATPSDFLNQLGGTYGLTWFYQNGTLFVSRSNERIVRAIQPPGMSISSMREALTEIGMYEPKFGWGEIQDRGVALVTGPPEYVDMITQAVAALPAVVPNQQIEIIKLRHAQSEDRTVYFRDKRITTPGVATILRNLVTGENRRGLADIQLVEMAQPLRTPSPAGQPPLSQDYSDAEIMQEHVQRKEIGLETEVNTGSSDQNPRHKQNNVVATASPGWLMGQADERSSIQSDPSLNAIIIRDNPERIRIYKQLIAALDIPAEQIEIEAIVIDINTTKLTELGIDWTGQSGSVGGSFGQAGVAPGPTTLTLTSNPVGLVSNVGSFLLARLQLLQSDGSAKILSRLPLLTMDNVGAVIDTSDTYYIQTTTNTNTSSTGGISGTQYSTVTEPITVGATLRVTPHVIHDGANQAVQLFVDIDDSGVQNISTTSPPTIRRTTVGTQAVIGDGQGLLIAGFSSDQAITQKDQVPVLGDIPLIGALFKKTTTDLEKSERMFLIVPRVKAPTVN